MADPHHAGLFQVVSEHVTLDPHQTALVICDMWDKHWCKSEPRVAELAPHVNALADALRARGALIIHCPSDTMNYYKNFPGRRLAEAVPKVPTAVPLQSWCGIKKRSRAAASDRRLRRRLPRRPALQAGPRLVPRDRHDPIHPGDAITDSVEAFYLMKQRGITNVLLTGVHENMCVLGRPFSIRQLVGQGMNVLLVRDLTDTMYNPKMSPWVDHFSGTDLVTEHVEKYWCPTITSNQVLGGKPFHFAADVRRIGPDGSPMRVPSEKVVEPGYQHVSRNGLEAWRDMKFGLRIHWGLYSIPPVGPESWPLTRHDMAWDGRYYQNYKTWDPKGFDADAWMSLMKRGGMKFFVFTTKHHEGFSMFDTKTRVKRFIYAGPNAGKIEDCDLAYSIMETPFHRDVVKEWCDAARCDGIAPGLYFSHIDWYDADFRIDRWHPLLRFVKNLSYRPEDDPQALAADGRTPPRAGPRDPQPLRPALRGVAGHEHARRVLARHGPDDHDGPLAPARLPVPRPRHRPLRRLQHPRAVGPRLAQEQGLAPSMGSHLSAGRLVQLRPRRLALQGGRLDRLEPDRHRRQGGQLHDRLRPGRQRPLPSQRPSKPPSTPGAGRRSTARRFTPRGRGRTGRKATTSASCAARTAATSMRSPSPGPGTSWRSNRSRRRTEAS